MYEMYEKTYEMYELYQVFSNSLSSFFPSNEKTSMLTDTQRTMK
jgi:hypothetical protein